MSLEKIGGYEVTHVENGIDAVAAASRQAFDVIVLDGMMPGKSGLDAAREIRANGLVTTPIIFLSAKNDERDIAEFLTFGTGFIAKPFDPMSICQLIEQILKKHADETGKKWQK